MLRHKLHWHLCFETTSPNFTANSCGFQESVWSEEIQPGELSHSKAENSASYRSRQISTSLLNHSNKWSIWERRVGRTTKKRLEKLSAYLVTERKNLCWLRQGWSQRRQPKRTALSWKTGIRNQASEEKSSFSNDCKKEPSNQQKKNTQTSKTNQLTNPTVGFLHFCCAKQLRMKSTLSLTERTLWRAQWYLLNTKWSWLSPVWTFITTASIQTAEKLLAFSSKRQEDKKCIIT